MTPAACIHNCSVCGEMYRDEDPTHGDLCFFCALQAQEETTGPCDFDEFVHAERSPEEWSAWQRFCADMGYEVPHFRSEWVGNKTQARKVTERCPDCSENCVSRDGCPWRE